ncbi:MAG: hypothetical protein AAF802_17035 [Planctomycetota bacterium]
MSRAAHTIGIATILLSLIGCRASQKHDTELESIIQAVSYDTSIPDEHPRSYIGTSETRDRPVEPLPGPPQLTERLASFRETVGDGVRATLGFVFLGLIKIVGAALDSGDDEDFSTSRSQADRNFNQWLDDRERWRRNG